MKVVFGYLTVRQLSEFCKKQGHCDTKNSVMNIVISKESPKILHAHITNGWDNFIKEKGILR